MIRYVLADAAGSTAVLGKLRARDTDRRTPALHAALRAAGLDGAGPHRVGVPRALGQVDELRLWLQEEVPGRRIADHPHPDAGTRAAAQAGQALARLHACAVLAQRRWTLADEAEVLGRTLEEAARALPSDAVRIRRLAALGTELTSRLGPGLEAILHRDWHPDRALLEGELVWVLDLDLHARGDPAIDLGKFVAHVAELAIRRHGDVGRLADHERAFLDGYADGGGRADMGRVGALKALSLARLVGIGLRLPGRRAATRAILDAAERLVADALRTFPGRVEPEAPVRARPAMVGSDQAAS